MSEQDYLDMIKYKLCHCGSKLSRHALYDGYGIFLTYACNQCEKEKLKEFRCDIYEHYEHDEPLDNE